VDGVSRFACVRVEHFAAAALVRCGEFTHANG